MPATFSIPLIVVIPGQLITASLWNNEYTNLFNNFIPAGMDDYSSTDLEMQTQTDPFPGGSTSRPTSLQGEIERIRYQFFNILGTTYWYQDPAATIANINTRLTTVETSYLPAGTVSIFYQAAAPTGWTQLTTQNDKALRVVSGSGGVSGGTHVLSTSLSHSHTVNSHTHDLSNHRHISPVANDGSNRPSTAFSSGWPEPSSSVASSYVSATTSATTTGTNNFLKTSVPDNNTSGATSPGTNTQFSGSLAYIDVIICSKN